MTFYELLVYLAENEHLPAVIKDLGIALITIFIGVLIFIIPPSEKNIKDDVDVALKKYLISKEVINAKLLVSGVLLIYLPFLLTDLWDTNPSRKIEVEIFAFFLSIIGIFIILFILYKCYRWIISDVHELTGNNDNYYNQLEKKYLTKRINTNATFVFFILIWKRKYDDNDSIKEKKYFDYFLIYLKNIKKRQEQEPVTTAGDDDFFYWSLSRYNELVSNRNLKIPYLLNYFTEKWIKLFFENYSEPFGHSDKAILDIIAKHINAFFERGQLYVLFSVMTKTTEGKPKQAIWYLFSSFTNFFKLAFNQEVIWQSNSDVFPKEWKLDITKEPLGNPYNELWVVAFLNLASSRYVTASTKDTFLKNQEFIKHNQNIIETLLPGIDAKIFDYFLALRYAGYYTTDGKIKSIIGQYPQFFESMVHITWGPLPSPEESRAQFKSYLRNTMQTTFKIVLILFPAHAITSVKEIDKYIADLAELKSAYEKNTREFYRRLDLLRTLKWFRYYLKNKDDCDKKFTPAPIDGDAP